MRRRWVGPFGEFKLMRDFSYPTIVGIDNFGPKLKVDNSANVNVQLYRAAVAATSISAKQIFYIYHYRSMSDRAYCEGKTGNYHKVMTHTDTKCFKDPTYDIFMKSSRTFLARFGLVVLLLFLYFWMAARVWLCSLSKSSFRINMFSRRFCFLSLAISICLFSRPRQICFFSAIHTEAFNWNGMFRIFMSRA